MRYFISYKNPLQHYVDIECELDVKQAGPLEIQLPSWRPGRYELGNFAKNIQRFTIEDENQETLPFQKISKDRWQVKAPEGKIRVKYNYYAYQMDAGSSWLDEEQLYLNFVNCLVYADAYLNEECTVHLQLPSDYQLACGLEETEKHTLTSPNYYVLVDSPMIASNRLKHEMYVVEGHEFHIWGMGNGRLNWERLLRDFDKFTREQIASMHGFPAKDYHFLFQFLPYRAYHGVEHFNSTVITLGPDYSLMTPDTYNSLIGVSSHELFHTWNIIRIRPAEMWPYKFDRENYFTTGFVAEGFTTYYGDVFLARSGVFSLADYLAEMNKTLQRHLTNAGRFNHALTDSSYDLWLDGYSPGIPNRKVSIYIKGSLVTLMLDLSIREHSGNQHSLDDVMRHLMQEWYGTSKGYTYEDIVQLSSHLAGQDMQSFFDRYIKGIEPIEEELNRLLQLFGLCLKESNNTSPSQGRFGFRTIQRDGLTVVNDIHTDSPADRLLSRNDELVAVNGLRISNGNLDELIYQAEKISLSFFRNNRLHTTELASNNGSYYTDVFIVPDASASEEALRNRRSWLNH